jgi:hypothetical protein
MLNNAGQRSFILNDIVSYPHIAAKELRIIKQNFSYFISSDKKSEEKFSIF